MVTRKEAAHVTLHKLPLVRPGSSWAMTRPCLAVRRLKEPPAAVHVLFTWRCLRA